MEAVDWEGKGEQAMLLFSVLGSLLSRKDPCTGQRFTERKQTRAPFCFFQRVSLVQVF